MNLKDAILSTITEIQNHEDPSPLVPSIRTENIEAFSINESHKGPLQSKMRSSSSDIMEDQFLKDLRERILVLFEGFQSPNNVSIEAKVDLTLNFLEHLLAKIDKKLEDN